jgi:hypothetical protein
MPQNLSARRERSAHQVKCPVHGDSRPSGAWRSADPAGLDRDDVKVSRLQPGQIHIVPALPVS